MAEQGAGREENCEPEEQKKAPLDEQAAWEAIVAGYGDEPADPPGARPFKSVEEMADLDREFPTATKDAGGSDTLEPERPLGGSVSFAPGIGPRDYRLPDENAPAGEDGRKGRKGGAAEDDDEGHFVPPEPPPLPEADTTTRFAWVAVLGGPLLLLLAVLLNWDMTWWLTTLGVGGFLGGFATLVVRMNDGDEDDDPGRGAVV
ncbi:MULTISPECIES: hypothetical protein [Streptomyces]|uniref:hypothetical protein n=1 Tax=Streptomyces TaxID=1883 RepID=UPI002A800D77|nr:hypothetical protein [Streptomyces sp. S399]WPR50774.1 hypothetical protein SJI45_06615 [Streptomyces sp. S399]